MASDVLPRVAPEQSPDGPEEGWGGLPDTVRAILRPLASLKLTVASFGMAIFIILAGTLAQIDKDIWEVMGQYFRTPLAWIPFQIFFPRSWGIPGGIYFPGGFTIGLVMFVNLLAAHALRFKIQAGGARLIAGLATIALGVLVTWQIIALNSSEAGLQGIALVEWSVLWTICKAALTVLWLATVYSLLRLDRQRKLERILLGFKVVVLGGVLGWLLYQGEAAALGDSSMRILWQLLQGGLASLVLLGGAVMVFRKRAGIVLLHSGVALMMLNELVVHTLHVEGQMQIREGQTINYVQDVRKLELAVVDTSHPEHDSVVAVPGSVLRLNNPDAFPVVADARLPFDVQVVRFMQNSRIRKVEAGEKNPATRGLGLSEIVEEARPTAGTDNSSEVDMSAAYVKFLPKGAGGNSKPLGTHLLSLYQSLQDIPETITVDGKKYDVYLRFKRHYKPYSMHLVDVRFDRYMGTNTPKNYSSELRLVDPSRNVDRPDVKIWMNNPLRFAGETFYQSEFKQDQSGNEITGLQVVTNAGWMIPYVACMIVATGLLAHFSIVLVRFLRRRDAILAQPDAAPRRGKRSAAVEPDRLAWIVPLALVVACGGWVASKARPPSADSDELNLYEFGKLPIVHEGRVKPFDTLARTSLRVVSDRETFVDNAKEKRPAIEWLLDVITDPGKAKEYRVFRIQNLEVLNVLGLERRKGYRYAIEEFEGRIDEFRKQAAQARKTPAAQLSVFHKKLVELEERLNLYTLLGMSFDQPSIRPEHAAEDLLKEIRFQERISQLQPPLVVPPEGAGGSWEPFSQAFLKAWAKAQLMGEQPNPDTVALDKMLVSYANGDAEEFNEEVAKYRERLEDKPPAQLDTAHTDFEAYFNAFGPFTVCMVLYVAAFAMAALSWLGWSVPLNRAAFWLIALTLVVHSFALIARIYISGRPPVTNLYSSAVFIGWVMVLVGLVIEAVFRLGIGTVLASSAGFATLLIADSLAAADTFTVLQAVLDTQFWLATHVVCITTGYAATYVAGLLGMIYILRGVFTPSLSPQIAKELYRMIYGAVCFAIFFSFVGTVLGGLWADDSWGRFWGWDPKENGALIIVLWNALVLHARWDGMVRERGLAVLSVVGNIAVSWSWWGVNQLGTGLHSYGFTEGVALALGLFVLSQLAIVGAGSLPYRLWRSRLA